MKKLLLLIFAIILVPQIYAKVNLDTIISQITKVQLRKNPTDTIKLIKTEKKYSDYIPINQRCDTIFIEETEYAENWPIIRIWNKKNYVVYNLFGPNDYIFYEEPGYTDALIDRINHWDTEWLTKFWQNTKMIIKGDLGVSTTTRIIIHNGFASFESILYPKPFVEYNSEYQKCRKYLEKGFSTTVTH